MFTHGRLTQGDIVRRLIAAGMLLALLVLIALLRAPNTEASAAYLEEDVPEEAAGIEIFLTGENGSAVRHRLHGEQRRHAVPERRRAAERHERIHVRRAVP